MKSNPTVNMGALAPGGSAYDVAESATATLLLLAIARFYEFDLTHHAVHWPA